MRVLWLNSGLLLPLDKGGKLRTWHLMRHLAARHDVTCLSFADPSADPEHLAGMREVCSQLVTVPRRDAGKGSARFYLDAARHLADPLPYAVAKYQSREYREQLHRLLSLHRFDALVCDFLVPAVNMPIKPGCPAVLFTHNVEAEIWRRHVETEPRAWRRALLRQQWRRMQNFEGHTVSRFEVVMAVSEADRNTLTRLYGRHLSGPIRVIQTGVDTRYFADVADSRHDPFLLAFTGSMDWLPNEDAILYFCREVLPRIRAVEPRVALSIIGRNPTPAVRRMALEAAGIEVTGRVDDIRPHVGRAALSIVPLRIGGGTRLKIYEAMAMGRAVVSTTIGAEGLPLTPGEHIALADEPETFADAVLHLLKHPEARRAMAGAARSLVVERYDWSAVAGTLEDAIRAAVLRGRASGMPSRKPSAPLLFPARSPARGFAATDSGTDPARPAIPRAR